MGWILRASLAFLVLGSTLHRAHAQAIVDEKGSLSASLQHEYGFANKIVYSQGVEEPYVYVNSQTTTLDVEYVPISKLGVSLSLPLVGTLYNKDKAGMAFDPHGPYDTGTYHFTLQDLHGDARYQLLDSPLALSVGLGFVLPVADYPVQGSAAPGRHLKQGRAMIAASYSPEALPNLFVNLEYSFTLSEKYACPEGQTDPTDTTRCAQSADTKQFSQNRSDGFFQAGYLVTDKLAAYLLSSFRYFHDGVDFINYDMLTNGQQNFHDPILHESALAIGAGAMYQFNEKLYATVHYLHFVTGKNTLMMDVAGVSVGWNIL